MHKRLLFVIMMVCGVSMCGASAYEHYPNRTIYVNHVGYKPGAAKMIVAAGTEETPFEVCEVVTGKVIYKGKLMPHTGDFGIFLVGDFTDANAPGEYEIRAGEMKSVPFRIDADIYQVSIQKSCRYFSMQRCGPSTTGYNGPCHLDDGQRLDDKKRKEVTGGWHDACDLRKWCGPTLLGMIGLGRVAEILNPAWDYGQIIEELRWGNRYFLAMQEPDGYIMAYCGGDDGNKRTNNLIGDDDDRPIHTEPAPASAQFDFIAAEAIVCRLTKERDPVYADRCLRAAMDCLKYCSDKKVAETSLDYGAAVLACTELYKTTFDVKYRDMAGDYADKLVELQIAVPIDESVVMGFFTTSAKNPEPYKTMSRGCQHLIGLCELVEACPDHANVTAWRKAVEIYCQNYLEKMAARNSFGIVPYGFYLKEMQPGRKVGKYWYRYFMGQREQQGGNVDYWWVGVNSNLASSGVGLVKASRILERPALAALAQRQLDWIVGCNPFNSSTVSGVGYNQPALFVTDEFTPPTPVIPGGVMNGIGGTDESDMPLQMPGSWQTCEYWTPMVAYTMWLMTELQQRG